MRGFCWRLELEISAVASVKLWAAAEAVEEANNTEREQLFATVWFRCVFPLRKGIVSNPGAGSSAGHYFTF